MVDCTGDCKAAEVTGHTREAAFADPAELNEASAAWMP